MINDLVGAADGGPVQLAEMYRWVEVNRPDLAGQDPDPHAPGRPQWQHDLRWELQSAVTSGRVLKRSDLGRGFYSALVGVDPSAVVVRIAPIELVKVDRFDYPSLEKRTARRQEGALVKRFERWSLAQGRTVGRIEFSTARGERFVADVFDEERELMIEAKAAADRGSIRMALGQLLDYDQMLPTAPDLAILVPAEPARSAVELLTKYCVGLIIETERGEFEERLITRPG